MEKAFEESMKQRLLEMKESLMKTLMQENEDFEAMVHDLDPKDLADIAADDMDRKTIEAVSAQEMRQLRQIDSALSRIKNGRFGVCMRCGKRIPDERLEAIPYAMMCIDCKSTDEKKRR